MENEHVQNLEYGQAIEKIKELTDHTKICLFTSNLNHIPLSTRPMHVEEVDDEGCLWFISPSGSGKNEDILTDPRVQLFFSNPSKAEFLSVYGMASISKDRERINTLWNKMANAWFENGKNDPKVSLIKIKPEQAFYWDTKNNKIISMLKIAASAVTGNMTDAGIKGKLKV